MGTITRSFTAVTGATILAADIETDLDAVFDEFNGSIEAVNIASNAVTTTKINALAVTSGKLAALSVVDAKIDYTEANSGALVARIAGYPGGVGSKGGKIAFVSKSHTTAGTATEEITITFASDCPQGDPSFLSPTTPILMGMPVFIRNTTTDNDMPTQAYFKTLTDTGGTLRVVYPGAPPAAVAVTIQFAVWGEADA